MINGRMAWAGGRWAGPGRAGDGGRAGMGGRAGDAAGMAMQRRQWRRQGQMQPAVVVVQQLTAANGVLK